MNYQDQIKPFPKSRPVGVFNVLVVSGNQLPTQVKHRITTFI